MGFFSTLLEKVGLSGARAEPAGEAAAPAGAAPVTQAAPAAGQAGFAAAPAGAPAAAAPAAAPAPGAGAAAPAAAAKASPTPISTVDVVARLEGLARANPQKLNWKTSIVDLLKLLELDSSLAARKELATELGCPANLMGDSASMNVWLHKTVLRKLAENGGNIPQELLD